MQRALEEPFKSTGGGEILRYAVRALLLIEDGVGPVPEHLKAVPTIGEYGYCRPMDIHDVIRGCVRAFEHSKLGAGLNGGAVLIVPVAARCEPRSLPSHHPQSLLQQIRGQWCPDASLSRAQDTHFSRMTEERLPVRFAHVCVCVSVCVFSITSSAKVF